jgi:hypothetical protein
MPTYSIKLFTGKTIINIDLLGEELSEELITKWENADILVPQAPKTVFVHTIDEFIKAIKDALSPCDRLAKKLDEGK